MALNQMNKLAWVVNTIYKAGKISFEELNKKWMEDEDFSEGEELLKRTFHKWKTNILDAFGLLIECENTAPYYYYISNKEEIMNNGVESWLLNTYSVTNSLIESKSIKDRIILENVPSGQEYLNSVIDAMKKNRNIHISYYNYWKAEVKKHYLSPLCVKLFHQRWYMVGRVLPINQDRTFCLDRIREFRLSSHSFKYPKNFDPQEFFDGCFGIIADKNVNIEEVQLKVSSVQANYMRDLPMMPGDAQQEIERNEKYSIFKLRVRPTYDFVQELLSNREELEVLKPDWLRKEISDIISKMKGKYSQVKKSAKK